MGGTKADHPGLRTPGRLYQRTAHLSGGGKGHLNSRKNGLFDSCGVCHWQEQGGHFFCILGGNRRRNFIRSHRKSSPQKSSPYKDFLSDLVVR